MVHPDEWKIEPASGSIGSEVRGPDLRKPLSSDAIADRKSVV